MGNSISELRNEIDFHIDIARKYGTYLEPVLKSVQFFLGVAETGEGINRDDEEDEDGDKDIMEKTGYKFETTFISTEVELLAENNGVIDILIHAMKSYNELILAPEIDPIVHRYCGLCQKKPQEMPVVRMLVLEIT